MLPFLDFIRKRLALKIMVILAIGVALVMTLDIMLSVKNQRNEMRQTMTDFGRELGSLAYAGIKHPMAVGDSPSVEKQLIDIKGQTQRAEIVICDFRQKIVFATDTSIIHSKVEQFIPDKKTLAALNSSLQADKAGAVKTFEEETEGGRYMVTVRSILNEQECHHCHGATRQVLGALITRYSTDATYASIATLRDRTIAISLLGLAAIILYIYLVTKPLTELAVKAEQLAQGDLSVSVPVTTKDSVGILGKAFNAMVMGIKDQIELANSLKETIADPLFIVNLDMTVTYMNDACALFTGYSREEVEGKLTCSQLLQCDICDTNCPVRKCIKEEGPFRGVRTTAITRAGEELPIMASASVLKDAHGRVIGAMEVFKDITDVIRAERLQYIRQTAKREEEHRKYLETRAENILQTLSEASQGNLEVRAETSGQRGVMDKIVEHTNHMLDNLEKLYKKISSFNRELEEEVARRTAMLRERTFLLEQANRELRELDRFKSAFLANMSHELRTPMNSIIGYTDLLIDGVDGEINEEQKKSLGKVSNNAKHLLQLINDILDMSKIESGKIELIPQETDIRQLIESVVYTFEPDLEAKQLSLTFDFASDLPHVYIDADKARQILINLLSNAVKFTEQGGIVIHVRPSPVGGQSDDEPLFMEICVEDTGIGIKPDDMKKLFDKFTQIDVSTIRQYEGTGLGLSIARGLVVLHKGVIWAESEFGKGSRFYFTLPISKKSFEKPAQPVIETAMCETLASVFHKPAEIFMREITYGDKPVKCWEYTRCGQTSCPGYESTDHRCWLIPGTHCKGTKVCSFPEKIEFCRTCEVFEQLLPDRKRKPMAIGVDEWKTTVPSGKKTILVIDDNPEVIELIGKDIGDDYTVIGEDTSTQAVETAVRTRPDFITLDIMMPGRDGWQVLQDLKENPQTQDIPVIILSIVDEKDRGFSLGAAEYIIKPIYKNILLKKLKNLEKLTMIRNALMVGSDPEIGKRMNRVLDGSDIRLTTVTNAKEALIAMKHAPPDLVIIDIGGSDAESGLDFLGRIKKNVGTRDIPLILLTDKDMESKTLERLEGGFQKILAREGLDQEELLSEIKTLLSKLSIS